MDKGIWQKMSADGKRAWINYVPEANKALILKASNAHGNDSTS